MSDEPKKESIVDRIQEGDDWISIPTDELLTPSTIETHSLTAKKRVSVDLVIQWSMVGDHDRIEVFYPPDEEDRPPLQEADEKLEFDFLLQSPVVQPVLMNRELRSFLYWVMTIAHQEGLLRGTPDGTLFGEVKLHYDAEPTMRPDPLRAIDPFQTFNWDQLDLFIPVTSLKGTHVEVEEMEIPNPVDYFNESSE